MAKKTPEKSMTTIDDFLSYVKGYWKQSKTKYSRYQSWEHCYERFQIAYKSIVKKGKQATDDVVDSLSFWLAWYLASWGMYRGSSKLLMYNYKVHNPVVKLLLNKKWGKLNNLECEYNKENQELFDTLKEQISEKYRKKGVKHTDTLVSKILLGTLGCSPAFDDLFTKSISFNSNKKNCLLKAHVRNFRPRTMNVLCDFYTSKEFKKKLERCRLRKQTRAKLLPYPQMKILDMGFWYFWKKETNEQGV